MVTPRSRSSFRLSMTQARKNEPLPFSADSFLKRSISWAGNCPVSSIRRPTRVDLPWSTWPITTRFMWGLFDMVIHRCEVHLATRSCDLGVAVGQGGRRLHRGSLIGSEGPPVARRVWTNRPTRVGYISVATKAKCGVCPRPTDDV